MKALRCIRVVAVAAVLVGVVGATSVPPSSAASTFSGTAGGEVVRALVSLSPAVAAEDLVDPGALSAQASLTSFGESIAFASHPYPGSVPVSAPGLLDGVLASSPDVPPELAELVNLPEYPLIASSTYPSTPTSSVDAGTVQLRADSREDESRGRATDGANHTEVFVAVDGNDVVTASAEARVGALDTGPLLQVSGIRSEATVVQAPDGTIERTTDFSVATSSILGQQVRIGPDGIDLLGLNSPGLDAGVDPVQVLLDRLTDEGLSIRLIPAEETPDGVRSAGLEITRMVDTGVNGIVATVRMTLGRTYASVSNTARPPIDTSALPPSSSTPIDSGFDESVDSPASSGGSTVASPTPSETPVSAIQPISAVPGRGLIPDETDAGRFYPVLVLGGLVLLAGSSLYRKTGVSATWTS